MENEYNYTQRFTQANPYIFMICECQYRTDAGWFHVDQNPRYKQHREAVQGLVNLLPVDESTGGNVLVAKSHKLFPEHYTDFDPELPTSRFYHDRLDELGTDDWMEVDPNDDVVLRPSNILLCLLKPGDMVLWDSRVVHCSYPGKTKKHEECTKKNEFDCGALMNAANGLIRAGVLVSMMPGERVDDATLQKQREAVDQSRTLTHWADKVAPLGEERPDQVAMEAACLKTMKQWQALVGRKVL